MPFILQHIRFCSRSLCRFSWQRFILVTVGVISLELSYQGIGLALDCPNQPQQTVKDLEVVVNAAVAKIGPVSGGELKTKTKIATQVILGKLPNADRVYLEQMMFASYCSSLRDDRAISESQKANRLNEYIGTVRKTIQQQNLKTKQPTKVSPPITQPGKENESGTRPRVVPPALTLPQSEMKQPEAEKPCEQSLVGLKRRPDIFLPHWRAAVKSLRENRLIYDLQNLFEVWGRILVGLTGKDLILEATFTLKCLEDRGELRMEPLGTSGRYWGENFENQRIIFNP